MIHPLRVVKKSKYVARFAKQITLLCFEEVFKATNK